MDRGTDAATAGHDVEGRVLYPAAAFLELAWNRLEELRRSSLEKGLRLT
ncbi:MAG TPA: hypothetical protein VJ385_21005 [Fibrobacteria bacterium]|nr:hypothetical protein [Fibrobacteria bacterium]